LGGEVDTNDMACIRALQRRMKQLETG
jgi:hypothetical protein